MLDPTDPAAYSWEPPADRAIVDSFELEDLRPMQERVNRDVTRLAAIRAGFVATDDDLPGMWSHSDFEGGDPDERSYAERGWTQRVILGVGQDDIDPDDLELLYGQPIVPLCARQIPTRGTE